METNTVLLVEDSVLDADLACARLRKAGFEFTCDRVDTRQAFIDALESKRYDLILADFSLIDFTGREAMELAHERTPHTPFIFVSGVLGEELAIEMIQAGATDYVLKQRLDRLYPAVQRALSEAHEKRERRRAEAALRDSELRYRTLVEAIPQLIWTCLPDGNCDFLNNKWIEYTGVPEQEQLGLNWLQRVIHPDDRERVRSAWTAAVNDLGRYDIEYRIRSASGEYRWFKTRGVPVRNGDGRIVRWFGTSTDIEDQKAAEDVLLRQREALERSNADLQQFAYIASHDLQEPLRSVISYTQLLKRRYEGQLDQDADEFINFAVEGATRMQKLIQDLLEYSRSSREETLKREPVDSNKALEISISNLSAALTEAGASVTYDEPLPVVTANLTMLSQVFQNLLSNSIKYRREGVPPKVHVSAQPFSWGWQFEVRDNGTGFERKQAQRIFGIFQRLHGRAVPGTGMGLAICKRIIESNGGHIWAESEPGQGASFFFTLPSA